MSEYHSNQPSAADGGRGLAEAGPGSTSAIDSGAQPSNTAPPNYIQSNLETQILRSGIDSLNLSYPGELDQGLETKLAEAKEAAQSPDYEVSSGAHVQIASHVFEVRSHGAKRYPYVLSDNWFHLQVASSKASRQPVVYGQISSEVLTRAGLNASCSDLNIVADCLGADESGASVSRVDLCIDFVTDYALDGFHDEQWVTRAHRINRWSNQRKFSGYSIGAGGALSCRLYDKTLEIEQQSGKNYLFGLWQQNEWDGRFPVWRLEFQFRREVLKELGIDKITRLESRLNSLWVYALTKWLRLCMPTDDSNRTRWPVHPLWEVLAEASFSADHPAEPIMRVSKSKVPSDDYLFKAGIAGITSFMAKEGLTNIEAAMPLYMQRLRAYHRAQKVSTGEDLIRYAGVRADEKRKRYCTIQRESDTPPIQYRRQKAKEDV